MWRIALLTGAVGIEIAVAIGFGALGGQWLDGKFGTAPWLANIGFAAGVGAAIKALIRVTRQHNKKIASEDHQDKSQAPPDAR